MSQPCSRSAAQVGASGFAARQDDEVGGRQGAAGLGKRHRDAGLEPERIEIVEIGDARQARHDDPVLALRASRRLEREDILGGQLAGIGEPRDRAEARHTGAFGNELLAGVKQLRIALELVHQRRGDQRRIGRIDHRERPDQRRDDAPALDIANEHHGNIGSARKAEIGDIAGSKVHLRRAPRPLDQHQIGIGSQLAMRRPGPPA